MTNLGGALMAVVCAAILPDRISSLVIVDGMPAGIPISEDYIQKHLRRRQAGYGPSPPQQHETDDADRGRSSNRKAAPS